MSHSKETGKRYYILRVSPLIWLASLLLMPFFLSTRAISEEPKTANTLQEVFTEGRAWLSFRYRWENVDQDGFDKNANALTLRTRIGHESAKFYGFRTLLEVEDVHPTGNDNFNSTTNGKTQYPVVADPEGTEFNQVFLGFHDLPETEAKIGRYRLTLDDHRFIGDVGWRQNDQTFDGVCFINSSITDLAATYHYLRNINRIFGDDHPQGDISSSSNLFNLKYSPSDTKHSVTAFAYLLDLRDQPELSSSTLGVRAEGFPNIATDLNLLYEASYAIQDDYQDNPNSYTASYYHAVLGLKASGLTGKVGWEVLGSDDGKTAFSTPLATLHKFNGWADKFLTAPVNGLEDLYLSLMYDIETQLESVKKVTIGAVYHDFSAEEGSSDYGSEWDFVLNVPFLEYYWFEAKYANYEADNFQTDTNKLWLTLGGTFG